MSPGEELLDHLRASARELLASVRGDGIDHLLAGLGPAVAPWAIPALGGELLARIEPAALAAAVTHSGAAVMIERLGGLVAGSSDAIALAGRVVDGRRVPCLAIRAGTGAERVVVLLSLRADGQPGIDVVVAADEGPPPGGAVGPVRVVASGQPGQRLTMTLALDGSPPVVSAGSDGRVVVGIEVDVPVHVPLLALRGAPRLDVTISGGPDPTLGWALRLPRVTVSALPEPFASLVSDALLPSIDVTIATIETAATDEVPIPTGHFLVAEADAPAGPDPRRGLTLQGDGSLDVSLPGPGRVGPLDVRSMGVHLRYAVGADGVSVALGVHADIAIDLPGAPVRLGGQRIGAESLVGLVSAAAPTFPMLEPEGIDTALTLPIASGSGMLRRAGEEWLGALALSIPPMAVNAFGILRPPRPGRDLLSFLVVLTGRFPPPGVQIGFGFAVSGVGGIFGVNRRADTDGLTAAVLDGDVDAVLFPTDPGADIERITTALGRMFPEAGGRFVFGPMLQLTWAGGLMAAEAALVLDLPDPARIVLLGRFTLDLPYPAFALIHIEARFLADVDLGVPQVRVVAAMDGSVVGVALTGQVFVLYRGGPDATYVVSAGGFHPAMRAPDGVPALRRLGMVLTVPLLELRLEAYLALTTTSVQFGATLDVRAELAHCGVHGRLSFDALFDWVPRFHFTVDVALKLEVEAFGEQLLGIDATGTLAGPSPWHIRLHARIHVLFVRIPIDIDETWGAVPSGPPAAVADVGGMLQRALTDPSAWTLHPPAAATDGVVLSDAARAGIAAGALLHPAGSVEVRQRLLPLGEQLDRLGGQAVPAQAWRIDTADLGHGPPVPDPPPVTDPFPLGVFHTLTAQQQLAGARFDERPSGALLTPGGLVPGGERTIDLTTATDDIVLGPDPAAPPRHLPGEPVTLDMSRLGTDTRPPRAWPAVAPVGLLDRPPVVVVPLAPVVGPVTDDAAAPLLVAAGAPVQTVERWELG